MAKIEETVEIPARSQVRTVALTCDLCGTKSIDDDNWRAPKPTTNNVNQTTVESKAGSRYPDGADFTTTKIDICPACFHNRLLPWLVSQGAAPRTEETEW